MTGNYRRGDRVRVFVGVFKGERGLVDVTVDGQEKGVGVLLTPKDAPAFVA